ncbi:serine hydrolase [Chitinophaga sp. SYP-B3965]|uniref:serine hydrolase domain-containing protein n=1 Tax=Chitinophaga sp. SYP-B3965 TaxID=2663120 RepID=UPI001299EBBB|nr:serine hydrolase [Chitinophaga sp. SYP-B3965]MRG47313.1 serine hydrolase [Chitinophaga sp. SYP-B3965]
MFQCSLRISLLVAVLAIALATSAQRPSGKIFFSQDALIKEQGIQQLTLSNKTNLYLTVSLSKPLTDYLSELAPSIYRDSLAKVGNYQFSFLVDGKLIYQTELLPGAPLAAQQQADTIWTKPLIDNEHEGRSWSQSAWNRFMYNGGDSVLTDGSHHLQIILRPYVKSPGLITGEIIAEGQLALLVKRKPEVRLSTIKLSPVRPYYDLVASPDSFDKDKIKTLRAYIEADVFRHVTSVVALKNGKILFEEYFNGSSRDSLHNTRSVGKTFTSALSGLAIRDGYLQSPQQTLGEFYQLENYKHYSPEKARVTLKELLTMSSRFAGDDNDPDSPGNEENMYPTDNWVKFTMDLPLDTVRYQKQWHYFTAGVMLLGSTLDKIIPGGLEKYAADHFFKPLHIINYRWSYTPQGVANTAGGIRMNSLDYAKFGQLYANKGKWNEQQLLPEKWVSESLSHQLPITGRPGEFYGYLFWNKTYRVNGKLYEVYYCSGNGGNKIFIFKDHPLVVVLTATAYGMAYAHRQADRMMEDLILPAVFNK